MATDGQRKVSGHDKAYQNYLRARDAAIVMQGTPADPLADTLCEARSSLGGFFDASPFVIAELRRHWPDFSGTEADRYHYDNPSEEKQLFESKLQALSALDTHDLFVPESGELGGLGYQLSRGLANLETLKHYECLIAMDLGGALSGLRRVPERQIVLDVDPGWGGLCYALKRLFPNTSFVLSGRPERFLFSMTYLTTVFPGASTAIVMDDSAMLEGKWAEYDFVFVPNRLLQVIEPERLDLVVTSVAASERLRTSIRVAASLGCRIVYALCPSQLENASNIIEERYWVSEIPMLLVPYTKLPDVYPAKVRAVDARWEMARRTRSSPAISEYERAVGYRHLVGWGRIG